mgnify:CR=1 FL=1
MPPCRMVSRKSMIRAKRSACAPASSTSQPSRKRPQEAELASHKLMLRAGHHPQARQRRSTPGCRSGCASCARSRPVVREEMNRAGAHRDARARRSSPPSCGRRPAAGTLYGPDDAAHQGPRRARVLLRARPPRKCSATSCARRSELPPAAGELLPDPDQVPRRDPPALRRDARARVHR